MNYITIHSWKNEKYPKSGQCSNCGVEGKRTEWALIHGKEHAKGINNYKELCKKCHIAYDKTEEWEKRKLQNLSKTYSHRNRIRNISCSHCSEWFTPRRKTSKFCSNICSGKWRYAQGSRFLARLK